MGKIAVQRVVDSINAKTKIVVTTHVPVELIVRESTVAPAHVDD
jgi:DNA-binding LacI/PurR family transcriptional regulator